MQALGSHGSEHWSNQTTGGKQQAIESRTNKRIQSQSKPNLLAYTDTINHPAVIYKRSFITDLW